MNTSDILSPTPEQVRQAGEAAAMRIDSACIAAITLEAGKLLTLAEIRARCTKEMSATGFTLYLDGRPILKMRKTWPDNRLDDSNYVLNINYVIRGPSYHFERFESAEAVGRKLQEIVDKEIERICLSGKLKRGAQ